MARYNLFKGKSRGSIGDVTFSTQNGIQISRVRNRHPRNPRTNAQMFQRAIWATIIRIYSYGKDIFSTSFESAATPKQAMTAFMSANLDYLRELIITEIDNDTPADKQRGRVVHPQSYTPVPIDGLIVSQGTLTDTIFTVTPATEETTLQVSMPAPASATETLTQYAQRIGLTEETTYTIMANIVDKDINILYPVKINSPYAINYQSYFGAVRLTLKHLLSEKPISQATLADLFDIVHIGNTFTPSFNDIAFGTGTWNSITLLRRTNAIGTLAISAYNTNTQQVSNSAMNWITLENTYGIISEYTIPIWGKVEQTTNNEYIPQDPEAPGILTPYISRDMAITTRTGEIVTNQDWSIYYRYVVAGKYRVQATFAAVHFFRIGTLMEPPRIGLNVKLLYENNTNIRIYNVTIDVAENCYLCYQIHNDVVFTELSKL